jgi:hypothetical protein
LFVSWRFSELVRLSQADEPGDNIARSSESSAAARQREGVDRDLAQLLGALKAPGTPEPQAALERLPSDEFAMLG